VIALSREAEGHVDRLIAHYEAKGRLEAASNLLKALERAKLRIARDPKAGLSAPRPYPALARAGRLWIIERRYWISYTTMNPPVISGVFYATADIPNRPLLRIGWVGAFPVSDIPMFG
jgi:plasmid stabilization system protein ParE